MSTAGGSAWSSILLNAQGNALIAFNGSLTNLNFLTATRESFCAADPADGAPLTQIAPGQLVTLFGDNIGEYTAVTAQPQGGFLSPSLGDSSAVKIHGIPVPILYSSQNQINVQVPYEIAGQTNVKLEIDDPDGTVVGAQQIGVLASQPSVFSNGVYVACPSGIAAPFLTLVLNSDGSVNSCANPATRGSTITVFVNALGATAPGLASGKIASSPATTLSLPITASGDAQFVSAASDPGAINSVWAVKVKLQPTNDPAHFTLAVGSQTLRDPLAVWVKSVLSNLADS